jgi:hypothetical protein
MSIGAVLVGIGALAVVVAYVARPFRSATGGAGLDRAIEAWVAQARNEEAVDERAGAHEGHEKGVDGEPPVVNFCPQCGRQVAPDDRFCAGCGTRLPGGSV